jgi:hypothetical protein
MSRFRVVAHLAVIAALLAGAMSLPLPAVAVGTAPYLWLTPRTIPDWPARSDGNFGRTTGFATLSVDGRFGLISAGTTNPSHPGGGDWTSIYLSDNAAGTMTLASVDEFGNRFPANLANVNPRISPYGRWMAWNQYDAASGSSVVFARDNTTGLVTRSPTGAQAQGASYVTDDGRVLGSLHSSLPVGAVAEFWDVRSGAITALRVASPAGAPAIVGLSGDATTAVVTSGEQYVTMDVATGTTTALPLSAAMSTSIGAVSQNGRYIGFTSKDPSLNPEHLSTNQVYLYDRQTGARTWVSAPGIGGHTDPTVNYFLVTRSISDDGRYVIFGADSVPTMPPLDPAHAGEHVFYFYGGTFERDIESSDTRLVVPDYSYGVAPNAGVVQFDAPSLVPADPASDFDVYLSGPPTSRVTAIPDAPSGIVVVPGDHSATITWLKPASDGGSEILGYTVTASPGGQACSTDNADVLTCTITGLSNGVNYTFSVRARNGAGASPPASTPVDQPTTVGTPPDPVPVLPPEADPVDGTRVTLRWLAAQSDPNLPIIGYKATAEPGEQSCSTTGELFCTITGLSIGQSYSFTVVAINGVGPSLTTNPDPPTTVNVTAGGYGHAVVAWTAPTSTGGSPIAGYTATAGPDGPSCTSTGSLSCTVGGLTPGAPYTFTVTATTSHGRSDPSRPSQPFTTVPDTTPPSVVGQPDRDPDVTITGQGWWRGHVTVTWVATDGESGVAGAQPPPSTVTAQGESTATSTRICDQAGNCATGTVPIRIDSEGPAVTITGVADGAAYPLGAVPAASCTATDAVTGVDGECTVSVTGGNANHVGPFTVSATARDQAGNITTVTANYGVQYAWNGFDQPINDTAHHVDQATSVFKAGSTVPVKFTLTGADGATIQPVQAPIWDPPARGISTSLPVDESVYPAQPNTGVTYDLAAGHWQYNWKTEKAQAGYYWRVGVRLDDGTTHYVSLALR